MIEYPSPQIIEAPLGEESVRPDGSQALLGVHFNDHSVIGRALIACGVDPAEVPDWQVHTAVPLGRKLGEKEAAIDVVDLSRNMDHLARKSGVQYSAMFKPLVARALVTSVSQVKNTPTIEHEIRLRNRIYTGATFLLNAVSTAAIFGPMVPMEATLSSSILSGAVGAFPVWLLLHGAKDGEVVRSAFESHKGLREDITSTVLPIFYHDLGKVPRFETGP